METIVIEVDDQLAEAWRNAPTSAKEAIRNKINISIARELLKDSSQAYSSFLNTLRSEMSSAGLTQEELNSIVRDE
ncbi:hypothetical protein [Dyadobacter sp. OTU695]|uniref:hypothetical protein n=1 Tax=Dyadobacter sp. OTU695 TaxID=3043860 RepID=UPI00313ABF29